MRKVIGDFYSTMNNINAICGVLRTKAKENEEYASLVSTILQIEYALHNLNTRLEKIEDKINRRT